MTFTPYLINEKLMQVEEQEHDKRDTGWAVHTFRDAKGSGYTYTVAVPSYLEFGGNIGIVTPSYVDEVNGALEYVSEYQLSVMYWPHPGSIVLGIADLTATEDLDMHSLVSAVDKNGSPLGRDPKDSEEFYQEWLALHKKFNEPIVKMFVELKAVLGDDIFD